LLEAPVGKTKKRVTIGGENPKMKRRHTILTNERELPQKSLMAKFGIL